MTKQQFDVLTQFEKNPSVSPKEIAAKTKIALPDVTLLIRELTECELLSQQGGVTEAGLNALEPYRVKRAIFIAAGMGSRMMPLTLSCPKPLVRVNGVRIIDTLIDACIDAEVEEIVVVRGYLGECFNQLLDKYPNIKFVDNPYYATYNNISSAYLVRDLMKRSYIFESDIYLINTDLITKYQYCSNYLGVPCDETPDWCFDTDENLVITDLHKGGKNCHHMYGIGYYDDEAGELFEKYVDDVFNNVLGGKDHFYDDVLCHYYVGKTKIYVRECSFTDTMEIDSFDELCEIDERYAMKN